jgi:hypothetical protein
MMTRLITVAKTGRRIEISDRTIAYPFAAQRGR